MPNTIDIIAFDADDTLWHNERLFNLTQDKFVRMLSFYHAPSWINKRLLETQVQNLKFFGYGIKGFTLSMIETAIELTEGRIQGNEIRRIVELCKEMIRAPIELLDHVAEVIPQLAGEYTLMIVTKGDLFDQQSKIARSGLADYFQHVEILTEKNELAFGRILQRYAVEPSRFLMVGNSLKSDILPVVALHANAVYIPYESTWEHEQVSQLELEVGGYTELKHLGELPAYLAARLQP